MCKGIPLTNEFKIDIARLEIPVSGWTCLRTAIEESVKCFWNGRRDSVLMDGVKWIRCRNVMNAPCFGTDATSRKWSHTFVDVRRVCLLARLGALLLVTGRGGLLASFLLLGRSLGCGGLGGGLLLCCGFGRHFGCGLK
jgi:hypothetical protein